MAEDRKIQWHPAFYSAMHLEFKENKEELEFTEELILNTMPLRVDMLLVKKKVSCVIQNEIGKIFKRYNLLEYKSPEDSLNYDVFLKGIAYAYLYKAGEDHVDEILLEEVTLTFVCNGKPVKLFKKLRKEKFTVEEKYRGIYYIIKEGYINMQIIVSRELSMENHIWLNSLAENIDENQVTELITITQNLESLDDKNHADSLWEVVATVNKVMVQKIREDEKMCKALAEIMKLEIDEAFDDGKEEKGVEVFINMITDGMSREKAQKYANISDELVEKAYGNIAQRKLQ